VKLASSVDSSINLNETFSHCEAGGIVSPLPPTTPIMPKGLQYSREHPASPPSPPSQP